MRLLRLAASLIFLTCVIWISSCKKADHSLEKVSLRKRFFNIEESADARLKAVVEDIRLQDQRYNFIEKFASKNGTPEWNKVIANYQTGFSHFHEVNAESSTAPTSNNGGDREIFFIPLVDAGGKVISYIACTHSGTAGYSYRVYRRDIMSAANPQTIEMRNARQAAISLFGLLKNQLTERYNTSRRALSRSNLRCDA